MHPSSSSPSSTIPCRRSILLLPISLSLLSLLVLSPSSSHAFTTAARASSHVTVPCRAGFVRSTASARCTACPPGTYREARSDPSVCVACPPGTFQPLTGVRFASRCRPCYPGTYSASAGAASCAACAGGKSSGFGSSRCVRCPRGTAVEFRGTARCVPCPSGQYSSSVNAAYCDYCPHRTKLVTRLLKRNHQHASVVRRIGCRPCRPGDACYKCPLGAYLDPNSNECAYCPLGSDTRALAGRATAAAQCAACRPGFKRGKWDEYCVPCTRHAYGVAHGAFKPDVSLAPGKGAHACFALTVSGDAGQHKRGGGDDENGESKQCPRDHFVNADGVCVTCTTGSRRDPATKTCVPCGPGFSGKGGLSTACAKCPPHTTVTKDGAGCSCGAGKHLTRKGACVACKAGSFRNDGDHVPDRGCEPCAPGWVAPPGASHCSKCPYGTVPNNRKTGCVRCDTSKHLVPNLLSYTDVYYEYGQVRCEDGRTDRKHDFYY